MLSAQIQVTHRGLERSEGLREDVCVHDGGSVVTDWMKNKEGASEADWEDDYETEQHPQKQPKSLNRCSLHSARICSISWTLQQTLSLRHLNLPLLIILLLRMISFKQWCFKYFRRFRSKSEVAQQLANMFLVEVPLATIIIGNNMSKSVQKEGDIA
ncbi:hypothetical protein BLNAU_17781 [Blattamonas nauphoetae]|uniref:Uncharacterized protein n=1 Tax=Blattamonas nauphoetae TaxID=2049346 RepID=A0ABQ9XAR3_9EUKA|nr:hypothetical protein BLNAU_17781 [Blattamonas nauphoetae]